MPAADSPHAAVVIVVLGVIALLLTIGVAATTLVQKWRGSKAPKSGGGKLTDLEEREDVRARLDALERRVARIGARCRAEHGHEALHALGHARDSHPGDVDE